MSPQAVMITAASSKGEEIDDDVDDDDDDGHSNGDNINSNTAIITVTVAISRHCHYHHCCCHHQRKQTSTLKIVQAERSQCHFCGSKEKTDRPGPPPWLVNGFLLHILSKKWKKCYCLPLCAVNREITNHIVSCCGGAGHCIINDTMLIYQ